MFHPAQCDATLWDNKNKRTLNRVRYPGFDDIGIHGLQLRCQLGYTMAVREYLGALCHVYCDVQLWSCSFSSFMDSGEGDCWMIPGRGDPRVTSQLERRSVSETEWIARGCSRAWAWASNIQAHVKHTRLFTVPTEFSPVSYTVRPSHIHRRVVPISYLRSRAGDPQTG